jgi:AraC family transcriptional regulator
MIVDAELSVPAADAQLVRFDIGAPVDRILREEQAWRLDLCLTPRPADARGCFTGVWPRHRFEPIGELFMVPPGQDLHMRCKGGRQESLICRLNRAAMPDEVEARIRSNAQLLERCLDISNRAVRGLLVRLAHEVHHPGFASTLLVELIAGQIAIELGRHFQNSDEAPPIGGLSSWRLRLIDERLADVASTPTLAELATLCNLSVRQLTRGFRTSRGCSIGDHIAHSRITAAKRRLGEGESVKAVAYALGFSSPSSFSYAFRRATGGTPGQFGQRVRRGVIGEAPARLR